MARTYVVPKSPPDKNHKYSTPAGFFSGIWGVDRKRAETELPYFMDCVIKELKKGDLEKLCRLFVSLPKRERVVLIDEYGLRSHIQGSLGISLGKRPMNYETPKSLRHLLIELAEEPKFESLLYERYNSLKKRKTKG